MKKTASAVVLFLMCCLHVAAGDIYVSPVNGSDRAAGTVSAPVRTIEKALRTAREWRRIGSAEVSGGINIILKSGVYRLDKPIFVRPEDSGTPQSPTVIRAEEAGKAVISGGVRLTGWHRGCTDERVPAAVRSRVWVTDGAPQFNGRILYTRQLWAAGRKMQRASLFGFNRMERMTAFCTDDESITIPTPAVTPRVAGQTEMTVHQRWATALLRVREMRDMGNGQTKVWFRQPESQIEFGHPWPQPVIGGERGSSSFALVNAPEYLDEPGEWYQDYPSGIIYYLPDVEGAEPDSMDIEVPALETLLVISGTRERHVTDISFSGLSFEHAAWLRPSAEGHVTLQGGFRFIDGYKLQQPGLFHKAELENQAWVARPESAVAAQFAERIAFSGCQFSHTGATALDLRYAVSSSEVSSCTFHDIGGTALLAGYFGEGGFETHIPYTPSVSSDMCSGITVRQNEIDDAANEDWGCVGIGFGYVRDVNIVQNRVSNVSYSGICVGWGWTALESGMRNNRITGNTVRNYARQCYDAGGIYTLSNQPGSVIEDNDISLPADAPYATNSRAFCIYFDEATDGFTVTRNRMPRESFGYNRPGPKLVVKDNIFTEKK